MGTTLPSFLGGPASAPTPQPASRLVQYQQVAAQPQPPRYQRDGVAILSTVSTGLGVASVAYPPVLPIAATVAGVQALDAQIGYPVTKLVGGIAEGVGAVGGFVVDGVVTVGKEIGDFFGSIFGGKKR
ncbi:MAG: hypothetical protein JWM80_5043 [Cyanobacteria bacterium RYN_339]|nr:hypothetical protein [Cyanobacteria bacterium RYN_339]